MGTFKFVTDEQQKINYGFFMKKLEKVSSAFELTKVASDMYLATTDKVGGTIYFMTKEDKDVFWDKYKDVKEVFRVAILKELDDCIKSDIKVSECKRLKSDIFKIKIIDIDTKKSYWNQLDDKIAGLTKSA